MKAFVYDTYGGPEVLQLREIDKPAIADDTVLVRVRAVSLNPYDWHFMRGKPHIMRFQSGLFKPKTNRIGVDFAGQVLEVGSNVTTVHPGDNVYGGAPGAFAEYIRARENSLAPKPANLTFEQAAAIPIVGYTALQSLRDKGNLQPGQSVLINGASGGVGTFAVQIAKAFGAEVTGVCSTRNVEMIRSLGADRVIDYTHEDFTTTTKRYDLMLDTIGNRTLTSCRRVLTPRGIYVLIGGDGSRHGVMMPFLKVLVYSRFVRQQMSAMLANARSEDLLLLNDLIESGKLKPVIERTYPLQELPDAMRYLETRRARGKIVITIAVEQSPAVSP